MSEPGRASASEGIDYAALYELRHAGVSQARRQVTWDRLAPWLWRRMGSPTRLLDPAAGRCEFVNALPQVERWVVDIADHAEHRDPAIKLIQADIREAELPGAYFDGIFVSNFLEHLSTQNDVADFLRAMRTAAAPGATIVVMGPNFRYSAKEYFDFADHVLALTHKAVAEHLAIAGFRVTSVVPRFLPYSFGGKLPAGPKLVDLYLKVPLAWRLLGKQFLVTAVVPPA